MPAELTRCMQLVEGELPFLRRALRRHGILPVDAEDVVQETVLVACRRWADYDPARPLRPWLLGIALRVAHGERRRHRERLVDVDRAGPLPDLEEQIDVSRKRARMTAALAALPEKHRTPVVMYEIEGLSLRQMAERWSVSVAVASARLQAGRRALGRTLRRMQMDRRPGAAIEADS